jgi:hypothetical protein
MNALQHYCTALLLFSFKDTTKNLNMLQENKKKISHLAIFCSPIEYFIIIKYIIKKLAISPLQQRADLRSPYGFRKKSRGRSS